MPLFDQISFLLVGAIALLVGVFNAWYFFDFSLPELTLGSVLVWLAISYFAGHLIHAFSNLIRDFFKAFNWENIEKYQGHEIELLEKAEKHFDIKFPEKEKLTNLWSLCYVLTNMKDGARQVEMFSAYYNLYRGWYVVFLIEAAFIVPFLIIYRNSAVVLMFLLSIFIAFLFYRRTKKFWQYLRDKVFGLFIIMNNKNI